MNLLKSIARRASLWALLLCGAFLVAVHHAALTYVCGNDPMLYQRAARVVLRPGFFGHEALVHSLTFVAPGHTLLLAATMRVFGDLAPYWLNLALLLIALPLIWTVLHRLMGSSRAAAFSLLGLWIIVLGGYELNAPFLLYPFREAPVVLCLFAAYALLLRAADARRPQLGAAGAGLLTIAACSFREPSVFLVPGLLAGLLAFRSPPGVRRRLVGGFLLPWLGLAVAGACAYVLLGYAGSSQFEATRYLRGYAVAWSRMLKMLPWIPQQAGWLGAGLIVVGLLRAALRQRLLLAWFLAPAVLLFVFYAFMQMHNRYFLAAFLYLAVFAGYGLDGLLHGAEGLARNPAARTWLARATTAASVVIMIVLMVRIVARTEPWGPRITGGEVRAWQQRVRDLEPGADGRVRIAVEQRCRYLEDLLLSYTDATLLDPKAAAAWPDQWWPAHYFKPLNRQALYATPQWLMYLKVFAHRLLADRVDVLPAAPAGERIVSIGKGKYEYQRVTPWRAGRHEQALDLEPGADQVVWLDWGLSATGAPRQVSVVDARTGAVWLSAELAGNGLQALRVPAARIAGRQALLRVECADPLSDQPVQAIRRVGAAFEVSMGAERPLSANRLRARIGADNPELEVPTFRNDVWDEFRPPALANADGVSLVSRFVVKPEGTGDFAVVVRDVRGLCTARDLAPWGEGSLFEVPGGAPYALRLMPAQGAGLAQARWIAVSFAVQKDAP